MTVAQFLIVREVAQLFAQGNKTVELFPYRIM